MKKFEFRSYPSDELSQHFGFPVEYATNALHHVIRLEPPNRDPIYIYYNKPLGQLNARMHEAYKRINERLKAEGLK